jgi:hypothetical protein
MELDVHYYAVYQLARLAGFSLKDAETIAYASQYVDDSTESEPIELDKDQHFDTTRTAHYGLEAFSWNVQKKIYFPFHFLPKNVRRAAPETFTYKTEKAKGKDDELSTMLIKEALSEKNRKFKLVRLGIALHTIADTFSHCGFSGRKHKENDVGKIWHAKSNGKWDLQFFESYIHDIAAPDIGHAEADKFPDKPYLKWRYENNGKKIARSNTKNCVECAKFLYSFLKKAHKSNMGVSSDLEKEKPADFKKIKALFEKKDELRKRCGAWKDYSKAPDYEKTKWRKAALKGDVDWDKMSASDFKSHAKKLQGKAGFDDSKWAYFHRGAFKQRNLVIGWLN